MKIAVILPIAKSDYLANTVLDGLIDLNADFVVTKNFPSPFDLKKYELTDSDFVEYAQSADIVILCWGKGSTNYNLAEKVNMWNKTVFVDGSELGKNNRFNKEITDKVSLGTYESIGAINQEMLSKCKKYFRREKPYLPGITPFPFGIETRYRKFYKPELVRDIDFTCIFGQDEYPILRRQVREYIEEFSKENGFTFRTKKTGGFNFDDATKKAGRDEFYEILSRTKVGVSIGGGGFDTARFWEILGSGAMLLTEKIDIEAELQYKRIIEAITLEDFKIKIQELGEYIRTGYTLDQGEYEKILENHSTKVRVQELINHAIK